MISTNQLCCFELFYEISPNFLWIRLIPSLLQLGGWQSTEKFRSKVEIEKKVGIFERKFFYLIMNQITFFATTQRKIWWFCLLCDMSDVHKMETIAWDIKAGLIFLLVSDLEEPGLRFLPKLSLLGQFFSKLYIRPLYGQDPLFYPENHSFGTVESSKGIFFNFLNSVFCKCL